MSEGRGTTRPFASIAAPWFAGSAAQSLAVVLNSAPASCPDINSISKSGIGQGKGAVDGRLDPSIPRNLREGLMRNRMRKNDEMKVKRGEAYWSAEGKGIEIADGEVLAPINCFRSSYFIPTWSKYNGSVVGGVDWIRMARSVNNNNDIFAMTDANAQMDTATTPTFLIAVQLLLSLRRVSGDMFKWDGSWYA